MLKGILAVIIVVILGITSTLFMFLLTLLVWLGQTELASAMQAATEMPLLGPFIMLAVAAALVWVMLLCALEIVHKLGRRR